MVQYFKQLSGIDQDTDQYQSTDTITDMVTTTATDPSHQPMA